MMNAKTNPLLSIVMPTKNRQVYAYEAIKQVRNECPGVEIVVSDNSDNDSLSSMVAEFEVAYSHSSDYLSSAMNYSRGIANANGEYICVIGDDDGVLYDLGNLARELSNRDIDALGPQHLPTFFWPNSKSHEGGFLKIPFVDSKAKQISFSSTLASFVEDGCIFYQRFDFARVYHGIAKRSLLKGVYSKFGRFVNGYSPDIYSAIAVTCLAQMPIALSGPITIAGVCPDSTSSLAVKGEHEGKLDSIPHLKGHWEHDWNEFVPKFFSVETIWAESALSAIYDCLDLRIEPSHLASLYARCIAKHPKYLAETLKVLKRSGSRARQKTMNAFAELSIRKLENKPLSANEVRIEGVTTLEAAQHVINNRYNESGYCPDSILAAIDEVSAK